LPVEKREVLSGKSGQEERTTPIELAQEKKSSPEKTKEKPEEGRMV